LRIGALRWVTSPSFRLLGIGITSPIPVKIGEAISFTSVLVIEQEVQTKRRSALVEEGSDSGNRRGVRRGGGAPVRAAVSQATLTMAHLRRIFARPLAHERRFP
jgi:hypothetical protein